MALIFATALPVITGKWEERMPTLEITAAVYYIAVLIAAGHACLHLLLLAWGGPRCWEGFGVQVARPLGGDEPSGDEPSGDRPA